MITIKSDDEIKLMREAGRHVAEVMQLLVDAVKPGVVVTELDKIVRKEYARRGVTPTFLGYNGYPATVCVSINEKLVHGIPDDYVIKDGDIVSIDLGATWKGFVGDHARTVIVGEVPEDVQRMVEVTRESLNRGIAVAKPGVRIGVISNTIGEYIESQGFGVVREYVGHGVGRQMHEDPQVPNYGPADRGVILRKGMALALEPMVTLGDWRTKKHADGWTVSTLDGSLCAHVEHTIAITDGDAEILTRP